MSNSYKYIDPDYTYTDPKTGLLRNLQGIADSDVLLFVESGAVTKRLHQLDENPIKIKGIEENVSIRINDLLGKTILEKYTNEDCELNTEKLSDGLYSVSILKNGIIATSKLVIVGNK